MALIVVLLAGVGYAAAWWVAARMAWGRAGYRRKAWWRRWGPGVGAVVYPAYAIGAAVLRDWFDEDRFGVDGVTWFLVVMMAAPTLALGAAAGAAARSWIVGASAVVASVAAPVAFYVFESGTHGRWYIRSEGLAILLSVTAGSVVWLVCMAGGTGLWGVVARRGRRRLDGVVCEACGYDVRGIRGRVCPECGREGEI